MIPLVEPSGGAVLNLAVDARVGAQSKRFALPYVSMLTSWTELRQLDSADIACKLNPSYLVSR
jgi:hypothetical protein